MTKEKVFCIQCCRLVRTPCQKTCFVAVDQAIEVVFEGKDPQAHDYVGILGGRN